MAANGQDLMAADTAVSVAGQGTTGTSSDEFLSGFYREAFSKFDANDGQPDTVWNWAAFLIAPIWYLAKGMWLKALVWWAGLLTVAGFELADPEFSGLTAFAGLGLGVYAGAKLGPAQPRTEPRRPETPPSRPPG